MLKGLQLSFTPDVAPYPLQNPSVGEAITTASGVATVTRTEPAGNETIIFADYGSGIEQPHVSEGIKQFVDPSEVKAISPSGWIQTKDGKNLNPLYYAVTPQPEPTKRQRRHSPKGKASGTIKERKGNTKRDRPSISHYYEWLDARKKHTLYIPSRQVEQVRAMIGDRCSVDEILQTIIKQPKETPEL